jgi:hypothetical protein
MLTTGIDGRAGQHALGVAARERSMFFHATISWLAPAVRSLRTLTALALLLISTALIACGSDESSGENVNSVIQQTFSGKKQVNSGKLNVDLTANLEGAPQLNNPISLKVSGPFQNMGENELPKLDLSLTATGAGQDFQAGAISTGEQGFIEFQGQSYVVPERMFERFKRQFERAQRLEKDSQQPSLGALGINPREWLQNPSDEGTEEVGGTETIHISADVDISKLLDDVDNLLGRAGQLGLNRQQRQQLPQEIPPSVKSQIVEAVKEAKVDVYTGKDDKTLRRIKVHIRFELPAELRQQAQGLRSGEIDFTLQVADLNQPQTIEAPKNAKPLSELQRQLGATGLGGLGGGSGSGSGSGDGSGSGSSGSGSSSSGSGGTSNPQAQRYLRCVEGAKDAADIQECASLLR